MLRVVVWIWMITGVLVFLCGPVAFLGGPVDPPFMYPEDYQPPKKGLLSSMDWWSRIMLVWMIGTFSILILGKMFDLPIKQDQTNRNFDD